jgi:hypothetical protein
MQITEHIHAIKIPFQIPIAPVKMIRLISVLMILSLVVISCAETEEKSIVTKAKKIEFLGTDSCANSPIMEKNLQDALALKGMAVDYSFLDIKKLPESDYRRGYGTPTVLVNGNDLFGVPRPMPIAVSPA